MGAPTPKLSPKPGPKPSPRPAKAAALARLRTEIARIEGAGGPAASPPGHGGGARATSAPVSLGVEAIDAHLGGGLPRGALHEIIAADASAAATGFALALIARILATDPRQHWLWCARGTPLYGPGLAAIGAALDAALIVRCADDAEALWAMEEALACDRLACVCGEAGAIAPLASRRLALAARSHGVAAIALRPAAAASAPSAAATRWRAVGRAGGNGEEDAWAWRLDLLRGRGAMPRTWDLLYRGADGHAPRLLAADGHDGGAPSSPGPSEDAPEGPAADPVPAPAPLRRRAAAASGPSAGAAGRG